jgi:hypothetical protein
MNETLAIRIQAYLDGELSCEASEQLLADLGSNGEGRELLAALRAENALLSGVSEKEYPLPVTHGYFWKGIAEGIARGTGSQGLSHHRTAVEPWKRWLSWLLPAVGAACVALVGIQQGWINGSSDKMSGDADRSKLRRAPSFHEVDSRQQNAGFISFRSESEGVSVVWISND